MRLKITTVLIALLLLTACGSIPKEAGLKWAEEKKALESKITGLNARIEELEKENATKPKGITSADLLKIAETTSDDNLAKSAMTIISNEFPYTPEFDKVGKMYDERNKKMIEKLEAKGEYATPTITIEKYNKLKIGMSYEKVRKIVGGYGTQLSDAGSAQVYSYEGGGSTGANAVLTFSDGELSAKAQYGLE